MQAIDIAVCRIRAIPLSYTVDWPGTVGSTEWFVIYCLPATWLDIYVWELL